MLDHLEDGDVQLGDAFCPTYFLLCELLRRGVDGLFEQYEARKRSTDFRLGRRLGRRDHHVVWKKPKKPDWMSQAEPECRRAQDAKRDIPVKPFTWRVE